MIFISASLIGFEDATVSKSHVDDIAESILNDYNTRKKSDKTNRREQYSDEAASQNTNKPTPSERR